MHITRQRWNHTNFNLDENPLLDSPLTSIKIKGKPSNQLISIVWSIKSLELSCLVTLEKCFMIGILNEYTTYLNSLWWLRIKRENLRWSIICQIIHTSEIEEEIQDNIYNLQNSQCVSAHGSQRIRRKKINTHKLN